MRRPVSVKPFLPFPFFFYSPSFPPRKVTPGSPGNDDRQRGRPTASRLFARVVPRSPSRPCRHPSIRTLCERYSLGARWVFSFSRCCYLVIDLSAHLFGESWAPGLSRSHLDSAVELSCSDRNSRPRRASLFGYCAMVRTPLRSPTTDAVVLPAFAPRQLSLVSWHFFLLALQVSIPISADHCLLQMAPECSALPAPSSFVDTGLLPC